LALTHLFARQLWFLQVSIFALAVFAPVESLAIALGESGNQTIITVSQKSYKVWIGLKSSAYPSQDSLTKAALAESSAA